MGLSTFDLFKNLKSEETGNLVHLSGDDLKRLQSVLLSITKDVARVCEEEGIVYVLLGGSLLGAVRHDGFIPWDDDIDLGIRSSDFDRFVAAFQKKFKDKYWIHTAGTKGYGITINRVRLKNSVYRGKEDEDLDECGIFVDLFKVENTYNNRLRRFLHGFSCMAMGFLLSCRSFYERREFLLRLAKGNEEAERTFRKKIRIGKLLSFRSLEKWTVKTQRTYGRCKDDHSRFVSVPAGRKHFFGELLKREEILETAAHVFEDTSFQIPKDPVPYLTNLYGDYNRIPDESEREEHILLELEFPEGF